MRRLKGSEWSDYSHSVIGKWWEARLPDCIPWVVWWGTNQWIDFGNAVMVNSERKTKLSHWTFPATNTTGRMFLQDAVCRMLPMNLDTVPDTIWLLWLQISYVMDGRFLCLFRKARARFRMSLFASLTSCYSLLHWPGNASVVKNKSQTKHRKHLSRTLSTNRIYG